MKKNWTSLIMSTISAVIIILMITLFTKFLSGILGAMGSQDPEIRKIIVAIMDLYGNIGWVLAGVSVLLGLWGVFQKTGNTLLSVFGILMILLGGFVMFLIPGVINIVAGNKGKAKFIKYEAEKAAEEKYATNNQ